jgi:hypothetical protein
MHFRQGQIKFKVLGINACLIFLKFHLGILFINRLYLTNYLSF